MFECSRCGYSTNVKCNLRNHLKRKKICEAILLDIDRDTLISMLYCKKNTINKKINKSNPVVIHLSSKSNPDVIHKSSKKYEPFYNCRYCNKPFKYRQGRYKHEKTRCKKNTENIEENEIIQMQQTILELQEQVKRLTQQQTSSSITNNSHNNNINKHNTNSFNTVNVNLNTLGNENIKYLKSFLLKNIKNIIQCKTDFFIDYVKQKHFHPEHIENHNVVSFNQRSNSMYGYMKQDTHLERRLKNNISLVLYKNIIDDVSIFVETQLEKKKTKPKKVAILNRAAERMIKQEDAIHDYEHKDDDTDSDENEKKNNIKVVDTHLKEIENTIYNESKSTYGDISSYYVKHNEQNDDISVI